MTSLRDTLRAALSPCPNCQKLGTDKEIKEQFESLLELINEGDMDSLKQWLNAAIEKLK